ncbi:MAG TPA: efflux RND transporter periplasmic adaptor subunit [Polyangia bacterium]|nr:efflux RND transporter periplasmic adaptor subunit [Polyangia bacterium]
MVVAGALGLIAGGLALRRAQTTKLEVARPCQTAIVTRGALDGVLRLPGVLRATRMVRVGFEGAGRVVEVDVVPGDRVAAGQILARLDGDDQEAGVEGAAAQVAEAAVAQVKAERALGDILDGFRADGVGPEDWPANQLLDGEAGDAQLDLMQATARAKRRAADLRRARSVLAKRTIRSPLSGVVLGRMIDVGETISASPPAPPLFVIAADLRGLRLEVQVDERYVTSIRPDDARFTTPAFGRDELTASVREIVPLVDAVRSPAYYTVVLSVPNPEGRLHVGMSALVELSATSPADALAVPEAAVEYGAPVGFTPFVSGTRPQGQAASIWLTDERGRPYRKAVEVGVLDGDLIEIRSFDLEPGMVAVSDRSPTTCLVRPPVSPYGAGEP